MSKKDVEQEKVLKDISRNGKERPWREKKIGSVAKLEKV